MGRDSDIGQKHESSVLSNLEVWLARDKTSVKNTVYVTIPYNMYFISMLRISIDSRGELDSAK